MEWMLSPSVFTMNATMELIDGVSRMGVSKLSPAPI